MALLYEDLLKTISKSGPCYRWTITILIAFVSMKAAFDMFVLILATVSVPYHCSQAIVDNEIVSLSEEFVANGSFAGNFSVFDFTCTKPRFRMSADGLLHLVSANATVDNSSSAFNGSDSCNAWTFKPDPPERWTLIMEYQMVCDREYLSNRLQTVMQLGIFLSTLFGPLGDIIGRKPFLMLFGYIDLACNIGVIFVHDLTLQMVLRFFMGFGAQAILIGVILITELVSEDYRGVHGNLIWIQYVIGYSGSAAISYYVHNWRMQMVVVVIIIGAGYVAYIPMLPESPRWLLTRRKTKRAKKVLKEICKYSGCKEVLNNFNCDSNELVDSSRQRDQERCCIFKFLPRDNLCRIEYFFTLGVVTFNMFTVSLVYFALSFERGFISNDPYLNVLISGLLELPAYLLAWQLTNRAGRKYTTLGSMGFCGVVLIFLPYIPSNPDAVFQVRSVVAIFVKLSITIAGSVLGVYGSEVLPTNVRSCSFFFACFLMGAGMFLAPELGGILSVLYTPLPHLLYGGISVLASVSVLLLPETKDRPMPNSVAEMEPITCPGSTRERPSAEPHELRASEGGVGGDDAGDEQKPLRV